VALAGSANTNTTKTANVIAILFIEPSNDGSIVFVLMSSSS
jgi:hypothetical protein